MLTQYVQPWGLILSVERGKKEGGRDRRKEGWRERNRWLHCIMVSALDTKMNKIRAEADSRS